MPSQNFVYADVDGHIGYYAPGRIPIRATGDGSPPAEGWTGEMEWTGWIPFDELPHVFDPPEHFIVTANHRPMPPDYPHLIALEYPDPYRAQRITDLLREGDAADADDFRDIQADTLSLHAQDAACRCCSSTRRPESDAERQRVELLRAVELRRRRPTAPPRRSSRPGSSSLRRALAGDELGPAILDDYQGRFSYITRFVIEHADRGRQPRGATT